MDSANLLAALNSAPVGLALVDKAERYLFASGAYAERLGFSPEDLVGMHINECMDVKHYELHIAPRMRSCLEGKSIAYQIERTIDGAERVMSVRYIPCVNADNAIWAVLNIAIDVTSDCRPVGSPGETLHYWDTHLTDTAGSTYLNLDEIQSTLQHNERLSTVGRAMAMLNHELRSPLGTLAANLKMLSKHLPDTPEVSRIFARSERAMQRCERVVSSLLDYSKPFAINTQKFDFDQWVSTVINDYRVPESIHVDWLSGEVGPARFDDELMRRAVTNVLENAVRELLLQPDDSVRKLQIKSILETDKIRLRITDSGSGFPEALLGDAAPKAQIKGYLGAGFGLLIARQVIERHGGRLVLDNSTTGGAVVEIQLPKRADPH